MLFSLFAKMPMHCEFLCYCLFQSKGVCLANNMCAPVASCTVCWGYYLCCALAVPGLVVGEIFRQKMVQIGKEGSFRPACHLIHTPLYLSPERYFLSLQLSASGIWTKHALVCKLYGQLTFVFPRRFLTSHCCAVICGQVLKYLKQEHLLLWRAVVHSMPELWWVNE